MSVRVPERFRSLYNQFTGLFISQRIHKYIQTFVQFRQAVEQENEEQERELCSVLFFLAEWTVRDMDLEQSEDGFEIAHSARFLSRWKAGLVERDECLLLSQNWIDRLQLLQSASTAQEK